MFLVDFAYHCLGYLIWPLIVEMQKSVINIRVSGQSDQLQFGSGANYQVITNELPTGKETLLQSLSDNFLETIGSQLALLWRTLYRETIFVSVGPCHIFHIYHLYHHWKGVVILPLSVEMQSSTYTCSLRTKIPLFVQIHIVVNGRQEKCVMSWQENYSDKILAKIVPDDCRMFPGINRNTHNRPPTRRFWSVLERW